MTFDWIDYYNLAENSYNFACGNNTSCTIKEAYYRNSISRAYYAVFCQIRNFVKDKYDEEFYGDAHKKLQTYLTHQTDPIKKRIGNQLNLLHQDRKRADYDNELKAPNYAAQKALKQANRIMENLKKLN